MCTDAQSWLWLRHTRCKGDKSGLAPASEPRRPADPADRGTPGPVQRRGRDARHHPHHHFPPRPGPRQTARRPDARTQPARLGADRTRQPGGRGGGSHRGHSRCPLQQHCPLRRRGLRPGPDQHPGRLRRRIPGPGPRPAAAGESAAQRRTAQRHPQGEPKPLRRGPGSGGGQHGHHHRPRDLPEQLFPQAVRQSRLCAGARASGNARRRPAARLCLLRGIGAPGGRAGPPFNATAGAAVQLPGHKRLRPAGGRPAGRRDRPAPQFPRGGPAGIPARPAGRLPAPAAHLGCGPARGAAFGPGPCRAGGDPDRDCRPPGSAWQAEQSWRAESWADPASKRQQPGPRSAGPGLLPC